MNKHRGQSIDDFMAAQDNEEAWRMKHLALVGLSIGAGVVLATLLICEAIANSLEEM